MVSAITRHVMFKRNALGLASVLLAAFCIIAPVEAIEIKVATVAPDGSGWMRAMRVGAAEIRDRTHGRVTIKFYPGGVRFVLDSSMAARSQAAGSPNATPVSTFTAYHYCSGLWTKWTTFGREWTQNWKRDWQTRVSSASA